MIVDRDELPRLEPNSLEAELASQWLAADRDENLVTLDFRPIAQQHMDHAVFALQSLSADPEPYVNAALAQCHAQLLRRERLLAREQALLGLDHDDARAERSERVGHLDAHHAAAEHDQQLGGLLSGRDLAVRPRSRA